MKILLSLLLPFAIYAQTGASQVSTKQPLTGAVTRNTQAKANDFISVKDFGATGNGTTDDRLALQAAINTGKTVVLPAGTYRTTAQLDNTTCTPIEWMPGASIVGASSLGAGADVLRIVGPCNKLVLSNVDISAQAGAPGRYALNLDATSGVIAFFHISIRSIAAFGTGSIVTTYPAGTDGIFDGVFDGGGVILGTVNLERAGDSLSFRDLLVAGTGFGFDINLVQGAGSLLLDHVTVVSCWGIRLKSGVKTSLDHIFIEPTNGCTGPASDNLIDAVGTSGYPVTGLTIRDSEINGTPGVATYLIGLDYMQNALISGAQLNLGTISQRGVRLTAHPTNTIIENPEVGGTNVASGLLSNPSSTAVTVKYTEAGLARMGPSVQVASPDGTQDVSLQVKRRAGQSAGLMYLLDENDHAVLSFGAQGEIVLPYSLANSVAPGMSVFDSGGATRRILFADATADYLLFGYQSPAAIGGGGTAFFANAAEKMRLTPAGKLLVGKSSPLGTELIGVAGTVDATGFSVAGTAGITTTKVAGACTFTIVGGIIVNVTGC